MTHKTMTSTLKNSNIVVLYSSGFHQLQDYFRSIEPPYDLEDIHGFNEIYRRIYPVLNRDEKRRSEEFVDMLIDKLEQKEFAASIFGVV